MNIKSVLKYLLKFLAKDESVPKLLSNANPALRRENTIGSHTSSVSRKLIRPVIDPRALLEASKEVGDYLIFPTEKFSNGYPIGKYILENLPSGSKSIPLRSKNPTIDKISKEMLDSRNDMKNFHQSRFYRKLLRKNGINEKHHILNTENNLDEIYNYIAPNITNPNINGAGGIKVVYLNPFGKPKTSTYLHEITHSSQLYGTSKYKYDDCTLNPESIQGKILSKNDNLISKYDKNLEDYAYAHDMDPEYFKNRDEIQANIRPLQMLMVELGWLPKLVYRLLDKYNIIDNLGGDRLHLIKALGEEGLADLLANLLKKGGKINKNETKKSL